jgi:outer membrane protein TolC
MARLKPFLAQLCVLLVLAPAGSAQERVNLEEPHYFRNFRNNYRGRYVPPINLNNSNRLDSLIRAGKIYLSLQDAIALALENNLDIELSRYGPEAAAIDLMRARAGGLLRGIPTTITQGAQSVQSQVTGGATGGAGGATGAQAGAANNASGTIITQTGVAIPILDPNVFLNYTVGHRSSPQSNSVTVGTNALQFNSQSTNFGYQQAFLTGTQINYGFSYAPFKSNNRLSDLNPSGSGNMSLQFTQSLLRGFGLAVNNRNIRIAKNDQRVSDLVFEQQVITTVSAIINLYWDLVSFNEDVKVRKQALALAEKLYNDNKKQVEIGTLAPIEIVRAEAEVASRQQDLTVSETSVLQQETIIKNALSRTGTSSPSVAEARIVPTDSLRLDKAEPVQPLQDLIQLAMDSRPELKQTQINIDSSKIGMMGNKSQLLPQLDVQGTVQNNALAGAANYLRTSTNADPFFIGGFGTALAQIFRRNFPDYNIGFTLSVPLRNRTAQADYIRESLNLRQAEIRQRQQINQIRVDVQNAVIGVTQARARYLTAQKNRVLQEQTLDAEQKKYALGASTIFFVIQAQRDLATAQASEVSAMAAYSRAKVQMELVTGQTLKANQIDIGEAKRAKVSRAPSTVPME